MIVCTKCGGFKEMFRRGDRIERPGIWVKCDRCGGDGIDPWDCELCTHREDREVYDGEIPYPDGYECIYYKGRLPKNYGCVHGEKGR